MDPAGGVFARAGANQTLPDDLTAMNGHLYTNFQNGVAADGTPSAKGATTSTVVEFDMQGHETNAWSLTGRCDGLTADPINGRLIATVNEDANSYLVTIAPNAPEASAVTTYTYSPSPADASGTGGTDSIAIDGTHIYLAHSNPAASTEPAVYEATLEGTTASLARVFAANDTATNAVTGAPTTLALTDPDSNTIVPPQSPMYAGQLVQDSQADGELVFAANAESHTPTLTVLPLSNGTSNQPTVDDVTFTTAAQGTLFVVDQAAGTINALSTSGFPAGTAFVAQPNDSGNPGSVGTLDPATGMITPLDTHFASAKGLLFLPIPMPPTEPFGGYMTVSAAGMALSYGSAPTAGPTPTALAAPIVGGAATPTGKGYWLVASDGGILTFGDATFHGSLGGTPLNQPIVGMAATPTGKGYWLVASDGGIFTFGDATFHGSLGGTPLNRPIVGIANTPTSAGYYLVASDGGIFTFGDATFRGSLGGAPLNQPIVGLATTPSGNGYWLVASDGGIFTFGDSKFFGSTGRMTGTQPIVGMTPSPSGDGYWLVAADGGVSTFGDAPFLGSSSGRLTGRAVALLP
jgi:hypothetical protein